MAGPSELRRAFDHEAARHAGMGAAEIRCRAVHFRGIV
jgi:hypothetical protein